MTILVWISFILLIFLLLALDLGLLNKRDHIIRTREALGLTVFWIILSLAFNVVLYFMYKHHWLGIGLNTGHPLSGSEAALQYLTGYIIEKSLSLDNIFVIAMIFEYFKIPLQYQHRVLFWGILGALIMRGIMIGAGAALINRFSWTIFIFGGFLVITAIKMLFSKHEEMHLEQNGLIKFVRRFYPVTHEFDGHNFTTKLDGRRALTPLFLCLLVVESSDVMFAVDSIPAIFAVTSDPFIVFTSNIFAILGLRALYFALASMMKKFFYLKTCLVVILGYVGIKMLISQWVHIHAAISLGVIALVIAIGVVASYWRARHEEAEQEQKRRPVGIPTTEMHPTSDEE